MKKIEKSKKSPVKKDTKATAKKTTAPKVTKKAAPVKAAAKKTVAKKAVTAKKTATPKTTKKAAPVKAAAKKTVAKKAVTAKKTAAPKATKKAAPVKAAAKKAVAKKAVTAKKTAVAEKPSSSKPIIVKMAENQNSPKISIMTKPVVAMAPQKISTTPPSASNSHMVKPVYRPIQVINKPLTPLQPVRQMAPIEKEAEKAEYKKGDYVCYPAHGVGEIEAVETQVIGGVEIKLYTIAFDKDRMRLKVPVAKAHASGLRKLSSSGRMDDALKTLQGRAHVRRAMWSRRAQEYETKINSGDPVSIAEVLRDLKRSKDDSEQSYSERQIYQSALERLAREVAAVEHISEDAAAERLENMIKGRKARASSEKKDEQKEIAA